MNLAASVGVGFSGAVGAAVGGAVLAFAEPLSRRTSLLYGTTCVVYRTNSVEGYVLKLFMSFDADTPEPLQYASAPRRKQVLL